MSILNISTRQIKAARELLAWSQETMAEKSGVSIPTIRRLEAKDGILGGLPETQAKIIAALERAGIELADGDEPGVKLRKAKGKRRP